MKIYKALVASTIFTATLLCFYYLHITYFKVDVVFYSAIFDVLLAVLVAAVILIGSVYFAGLNLFEKIQLIVIWVLAGYILAISIPTVIDRSLSFYMLEKIQQHGGGIWKEKFEEIFTKGEGAPLSGCSAY
jgi:hypothetical protein